MRLIGLAASAATLREPEIFRLAFTGLSDAECDALAGAVCEFFLSRDDIHSLAWAANYAITTGSRAASVYLVGKFPPPPPKPITDLSISRKQLSGLAFRTLRAGTTATALVARVRGANALLPHPLPASDIDSLVVWCVKKHMETINAG